MQAKDNSGVLFTNDQRKNDSHPNLKGSITVAGVDYWISAWTKTGKNGKFLGLAVTPKDASKQVEKKTAPVGEEFDSDLPF
jgi:hypothetical protein